MILLSFLFAFSLALPNQFTITDASCGDYGIWQKNGEKLFGWGYNCDSQFIAVISEVNEDFILYPPNEYADVGIPVIGYINGDTNFTLNETYLEEGKMQYVIYNELVYATVVNYLFDVFLFYGNRTEPLGNAVRNGCLWKLNIYQNATEVEKLLFGLIVTVEAYRNQYRGMYPEYNWYCHGTTTTAETTSTGGNNTGGVKQNNFMTPLVITIVVVSCFFAGFLWMCYKNKYDGCCFCIRWWWRRNVYRQERWEYEEL